MRFPSPRTREVTAQRLVRGRVRGLPHHSREDARVRTNPSPQPSPEYGARGPDEYRPLPLHADNTDIDASPRPDANSPRESRLAGAAALPRLRARPGRQFAPRVPARFGGSLQLS